MLRSLKSALQSLPVHFSSCAHSAGPAMASFTVKRDVFTALLLVAIVLLAAGTQPASAKSYSSNAPLKATVKSQMKHMTCVMNGVHVPAMSTRTIDVSRVKLKITVGVFVSGVQCSAYTVPVPLKYLLGKTRFILELKDCKSCRGCYGCKNGALWLRGSVSGATKFQKCTIKIVLPNAPGGGSPPPPPPAVLPPVVPPVLPPVASPPVTLPPIIPPLGPILAPIVDPIAPIVAPVGPILSPIVDPIVPIVAPILAPIAPILAPVINPIAPILAPITDPLAPILAPILTPITDPLAPILAPIVDPVAPIVAPIAPILAPILLSPLLPPLLDPILPGL